MNAGYLFGGILIVVGLWCLGMGLYAGIESGWLTQMEVRAIRRTVDAARKVKAWAVRIYRRQQQVLAETASKFEAQF